jgi:hypothetical protein
LSSGIPLSKPRFIDKFERIHFKKISDFEIKSEFSFSSVKMRQIGLEFGELTAEQKMRLDRFIQYHTINED